ncbi:RNA polymerase sigma factor RpoD/SigA [Pedobacter heparinus]|uniref:sigma-70 family RNA polymerase sigma factor n=1 Tax=Pedobacter heparinus TaxID=984 RepID=UPI00292DB56E|nr:RNA polymerase sigma factor RpoD/SigA [Pedobacter heparinus]
MKKLRISQLIARRDSDALERYLNEIGKIGLLDAKEEIELASRIRNGDQAALHRLVKCNLRFVVSVAKKYQDKGLNLEDLISEGNMGLIKAAERFDAARGFKFISFAVWWIRQAILHAIAEQRRLVRLPGSQLLGITKVSQVSLKLEQELERAPTINELSAYTGFTDDKVIDYTCNTGAVCSLDKITDEDTGTTMMDAIADSAALQPDQLVLNSSLSIDLDRVLNVLSKREQQIILLFYGINGYPQTSLEDMQAIFNLSRERIRQLKDKAQKTLYLNCRTVLSNYFYPNV